MNASLAKCACSHCGQSIEFEAENAGATVNCPTCGMEVLLFIAPVAPRPIGPSKKKIEPPVIRQNPTIKKQSASSILVYFFAIAAFVVGFGLMAGGCMAEIDETQRETSSAIRQNVYVVQYCTGFILMALSPIIFSTGRFLAWLKQHRDK